MIPCILEIFQKLVNTQAPILNLPKVMSVMENCESQGAESKLLIARKMISLGIIVSALLWSCGANEDPLPMEPEEPMVVDTTGVGDTTVMDTTIGDTTVIGDTTIGDTTVGDTTVINAPNIQTPSPVIHLADNLDEPAQLGWCIDTRGNGFNETLHTHSCKASGGDVQFYYDEVTNQICSVEFPGFCIEMSGGPVEGMGLSLVASDASLSDQKFIYSQNDREFRPQGDTSLCLAAGPASSPAGIYVSRSLTLELSVDTDVSLKQWVIVE